MRPAPKGESGRVYFRLCGGALALALSCWLGTGCHREGDSFPTEYFPSKGPDPVRAEIDAFHWKIRGQYNSSNFSALEKAMTEVRAGPPLFRDGSWRIYEFYEALLCRDDEKESMWQLHERIHQGWEKAYPESITAHIAHAEFLLEYAWHARGTEAANKVTPENWKLFRARVAAAQEILKASKSLQPSCPMWWLLELRVALGQDWSRVDVGGIYAEGKQFAPQFTYYDRALAKYLLPRWYGQPGEWEKAAAAEMQRPNGLGVEGYARTVAYLASFYDNIFKDSQASWPNTRAGFEVMRQKYPDSLEITSFYCRIACVAGDRPLAKKLFEQLHDYVDNRVWTGPNEYAQAHAWAFYEKPQSSPSIPAPK